MRVIISVVFLVVIGSLFSMNYTHAITVTPTVVDLDLSKEKKSIASFVIVNDTKKTVTYDIDVLTVQIGDGSDEITFQDFSNNTLSASVSDRSITLNPGEGKEIGLLVETIDSTESKVHVLGLRIIESQSEDQGIGVLEGFVGLVFVTSGNNLQESAELLNFSSSSFIYSHLPVKFFGTFRNTGKRIVQPSGVLEINNLFGGKSFIEINPEQKRVLEGQERTMQILWGDQLPDENFFESLRAESSQFKFGIFKANLKVVPWESGAEMTSSKYFIVFPWRITSIFFILFVSLNVMIRIARRKK